MEIHLVIIQFTNNFKTSESGRIFCSSPHHLHRRFNWNIITLYILLLMFIGAQTSQTEKKRIGATLNIADLLVQRQSDEILASILDKKQNVTSFTSVGRYANNEDYLPMSKTNNQEDLNKTRKQRLKMFYFRSDINSTSILLKQSFRNSLIVFRNILIRIQRNANFLFSKSEFIAQQQEGHIIKKLVDERANGKNKHRPVNRLKQLNNMESHFGVNSHNCEEFMKLVMDGLGMKKLPDMQKVNISQHEYLSKYREYLQRTNKYKMYRFYNASEGTFFNLANFSKPSLEIVSIINESSKTILSKRERLKREMRHNLDFFPKLLNKKRKIYKTKGRFRQHKRTKITLYFPLNVNKTDVLLSDDIEEAHIRLMLIYSASLAQKFSKHFRRKGCFKKGNKSINAGVRTHAINLKVFQLLRKGKRMWLDKRKIEIEMDYSDTGENSFSQWLQFDITKAVKSWLRGDEANLGVEVQCDNCQQVGARILDDGSPSSFFNDGVMPNNEKLELMPVLNIIGHLGLKQYKTYSQNVHDNKNESKQSLIQTTDSDCTKPRQRCCLHTMEVKFKEIKGFEFIIQPRVFDAGYCHGSCPPRYNPANHHAMLQGLIWKQNKSQIPRPCCAPSKLVELEILHVDEKDNEKLKISTWSDMRVVECSCS